MTEAEYKDALRQLSEAFVNYRVNLPEGGELEDVYFCDLLADVIEYEDEHFPMNTKEEK